MNPKQEWDRWVSWIGDEPGGPSIFEDVLAMVARRQIWDSFRIVLDHAPDEVLTNGTFQSWAMNNYVAGQGMAVRRQVDKRDDVISLAQLIDRVRQFPHALSRAHYAERVSGWMSREEADAEFERNIGPGDHIDPAIPARDLETLRSGTEKIRTWATKEVAHYDRNRGQFIAGLTYQDLHYAMDVVIEMSRLYRSRILGSDIARDVAMMGWESVFRVPWIRDEKWDSVRSEIRAQQERRRAGS